MAELTPDKNAAKRLADLRKTLKYKSVRAFAIAGDIDPSLFDKILKAQKPITENILYGLKEKLNINPDYIMYGTSPYLIPQEIQEKEKPANVDWQAKYIALLEKRESELSLSLLAEKIAVTHVVLEAMYTALVADEEQDKAVIERLRRSLKVGNGVF